MADSILRLKVDSNEYDNKLKRAAEGLQRYADECKKVGGTLTQLDDGVMEFVQALGKMDTVSTSTKQQLREMSNALTTLTATYRGLTDEEKASPFGKELAKSIDVLTERAGAARDAINDVEQSIRNASSDTRIFDQLAGGMTVFTSTMQTAQGAAKLLGVQMGDNVEVIAKLQAAMAVTSGLQQMQTMLQKQSSLMQGIIALQTKFNILAKANPYVLLASAIAAVAGAYLMWSANGEKAKKVQESLNAELENTNRQLQQIDKDTDFSVGIAQAAGKSWDEIHKLRLEAARTKLELADMNYDKLFASGASAEQLKAASEMQKKAWDDVMKVLNEGTIHDIEKRNGKYNGVGGGGTGNVKLTGSQMASWMSNPSNYATLGNSLTTGLEAYRQSGATVPIQDAAVIQELPDEEAWQEQLDFLAEMKKRTDEEAEAMKKLAEEQEESANKLRESWNLVASSVSTVGGALSSLEDPTAKVAGTLMQAVATLALSYAEATLKAKELGPIAWIAFAATGLATFLTASQSIKKATAGSFATGGVVPGNSFSGDNQIIAADAGELILTRAMQGNIASALQGSERNINLSATISGEQIILATRTTLQRQGRGEYITSRR